MHTRTSKRSCRVEQKIGRIRSLKNKQKQPVFVTCTCRVHSLCYSHPPLSPLPAEAPVEGHNCGHVRTHLGDEESDLPDRPRLHPFLFAAASIHFFCHSAQCFSTSCSAPLLYSPPSHHLSFPSMYIFRSRVIKSAPEGLCMKRRSLIFSQPPSWYSNTNTCIHAFPSHDQTANMFLAFISLVCLNCHICELYCIQNFQEVQLVGNWPKVGLHYYFFCLN